MLPIQDTKALSRFPFWTIIIILTNVYFFYLELTSPNPDVFISKYALIPNQVHFESAVSLFPFISSQFIHAGFLHIFSNMIFLWVFGNNVEVFFRLLFPIFYLTAGIIAGLTQYIFTPTESIPMLGASGAVAGVLGSYLALFPKNKIKTLVFIFIFVTIFDIPAYFLLPYWFFIQLFNGVASVSTSAASGGIAFLPHIGGFLFGFLTTVLVSHKRNFLSNYVR